MKTIGLIGGTSWVSTMDYYKYINEGINQELGGSQFSQCVIYSFNYNDILEHNAAQDWDGLYAMLLDAAQKLIAAGVEAIALCANTTHMHAERLQSTISVPIIHIAVATGNAILKKGLTKVGLLGTKFTMEKDFYANKLADFGIETIIPDEADREFIHNTISGELGKGIVLPETKTKYIEIIDRLARKGAEGIILGCTEIPLLIHPSDTEIPVFDTAKIHADAIVAFSLAK